MRTIRLRRVVVLVGAALGLLATAVPSAHATTTATITFRGTASLTGGLSYPCVNPPPASPSTPGTGKCPEVTVVGGSKIATVSGGNTRGFAFGSSVCLVASTTTLPHASLGAGTCSIGASGVVTGSCGLSSGLGTYTEKEDKTYVLLVPTTVVGTLLTIRTGTFHFTGAGGTLVVTGTVDGGGTIAGAVEAVPVPQPSGTTLDNSCTAKTADQFDIAGEIVFTEP